MSTAWSWASLAIPKHENPAHLISKVAADLSTCPKMQGDGQVDRSFRPLEDTVADWRVLFSERAGIAEHDGGMQREKAELMAYESCIAHWLNKNPPTHSNTDACTQCCQPIGANALAVHTDLGKCIWLHDRCHAPWLARRRQEAIAALATMGIFNCAESL